MKRMGKIRAILLTCALFITSLTVSALPTEGEWEATTISGNETVTLTGNVVIKGCITIPSGASLTIKGVGQTITPLYNDKRTMTILDENITSFVVNGNLTIEGTDGSHIKIIGPNTASFGYDGSGNDVSFDGLVNSDYQYNNIHADDGANYSSNVIRQMGTSSNLTLRYVDFSNIMHYASNGAGVLFLDEGDSTNPNNVLLEYVNIHNCMGFSGNSIIKYNNNAWNNTTMNHCKITNSRAYGYGGVLTSHGGGGNCCVTVTMNDCAMNNCVSSG